MLEFDEKTLTLTAYQVPRKKKSTVYEESDMYVSYQDYLNNKLEGDIQEYVIGALNDIFKGPRFKVRDIYIKESDDSYNQSKQYSVFAVLETCGELTLSSEFIKIMDLPYMDKYGVIKHNGKGRVMVRKLVQADDVTFDGDILKTITLGSCYISMTQAGSEPKFKTHAGDISCIDVISALADKEKVSGIELIRQMTSESIKKVLGIDMYNVNGSLKGQRKLIYDKEDAKVVNFVKLLETQRYSMKKVRDRLNDVLSIDRAKDHELSRDIVLPQLNYTYKKGTYVTRRVLKDLKACGVSVVYVKDIPNVVGLYTANQIGISCIPKGTELVPELRALVDGTDSLYAERDYVFEEERIIDMGTIVTEGLLEALWECGVTYITVKNELTSTTSREIMLESAIIGNRHFKYREVQAVVRDTGYVPSNRDEYVFINEAGICKPARETFTVYDAVAYTALFERLKRGLDTYAVADPDKGLRKKVQLTGEIMHSAIIDVSRAFFNKRKASIQRQDSKSIIHVRDTERLTNIFNGFGIDLYKYLRNDMQVIREPDLTNPIAYYSMHSKVIQIMKDANAITPEQHSVTYGHYGKLCPYETPSGKKMGVVNNKALGCKIIDGEMKTSYYRVTRGRINFSKVEWLGVREEEKEVMCDIASLDVDYKTGIIRTTGRVLARVPSIDAPEKMDIARVDVSRVTIVNTDPGQMNSLTISTVPFEGANDAARLTFETSMCKQAKALVKGDIPYVSTSAFEDALNVSPYFRIQAEHDGVVVDTTNGFISVQYDGCPDVVNYTFLEVEPATNSLIVRATVVERGQRVKAGETLVTSNFVKNGFMTTGVNVLIAYVPKGSNYEDGVFMSERLAHKMVSYSPKTDEVTLPDDYKSSFISNVKKFNFLEHDDIVMSVKAHVKSESVTRTIRSKKLKGFLIDYHKDMGGYENKSQVIKMSSIGISPAIRGDKTANRHGNKGVAPEIRKNSDMLELANGEFIDLFYNPAGVASRMNIGQILEANLSLCIHVLRLTTIISDSFNGASTDEIRCLLSFTYHVVNDEDLESVFNNPKFKCIPKSLFNHVRKNINLIRVWRGVFEEDGTAWLYDPKSGKRLSERAVIGFNYVYKLIHESEKKEHARAGYLQESYSAKLSNPTEGQAKGGGQCSGFMELDAYAAYGAVNLMHEILNSRGDNAILRNNMVVDKIHHSDEYKLDEKYAIRRSTEYFVSCLEGMGVGIDFEGVLPNATRENFRHGEEYTREALVKAVGMKRNDEADTSDTMREAISKYKFDED